jgi:hypothetical protein
LGAGHLKARTANGTDVQVRQAWFPREELQWDSFGPLTASGVATPGVTRVDVDAVTNGIPVRLEHAVTMRSSFRMEQGWSWTPQAGTLDAVHVGISMPQRTWHAWLLGLGEECAPFRLRGANIELRVVKTDTTVYQPDLKPLVRATLGFETTVEVTTVQALLDEDLTWVLEVFAGADVVPAGIWPEDNTSGLLTDYGRPLLTPPRRQLRGVAFERYMLTAVHAWENLTSDQRMTMCVAISAVKAVRGSHLEMSIIVMGSILELLATEWLTTVQSQFTLPTAAKKAIKSDIRASVNAHASGSPLVGQLDVLFGYVFSKPARERFEQLFAQLGLAFDAAELANFVLCRNNVAHTSATAPSRDDKLRAMLFGYAMVARCLLVRLGYHGEVYDERSRQYIVI